MRLFGSRSLTSRLLVGLIAWTVVSLGASALALSSVYRANAKASFDELLTAQAFNIMGALSRSDDGRLQGAPMLGDPRFQQPLSGWVWEVVEGERTHATSASLADGSVAVDDRPPFDETFRRFYDAATAGLRVRVHDAQLYVDDGADLVTVRVAGPTRAVEEQTAAFDRILLAFLAIFGIGLMLATVVIVRSGLRPLREVTDDLASVRAGEREALEESRPREVAPLVEEVNALLRTNREVVERARAQVGNLAHALKTPLAVMRNEADRNEGSETIREQIESMRRQIDTYLGRARIAAVRDSAAAQTDVGAVLAPIVRVVAKLNPNVEVIHDAPDVPVVFAGERQDLEEIAGNLAENAARHANGRVRVAVEPGERSFVLRVEDDGPGIPEPQQDDATTRGVRLDEQRRAEGSGLGLSIVRDLVDAYDGTLTLGRSGMGGLAVRVDLPCPRHEATPRAAS